MNLSYNFKMSLLLGIIILGIFLTFPILENAYTKDDSKNISSLSNSSTTDQNLVDKNSSKDSKIPNQYIVYLEGSNQEETNSLDPLEFYNSKVKDTGTELLQVYNNVVKGFAIKVPDETILEDLKKNPNVKYIGQDQKISVLGTGLPEKRTANTDDK